METAYKIEVEITPENGKYFWSVLKWLEDDWYNEHFDWATTPGIAWSDAYHWYLEHIGGK